MFTISATAMNTETGDLVFIILGYSSNYDKIGKVVYDISNDNN